MGEDPEPAMDEGEGEERKSRSKCWMIVVAIVVVAILALCAIAIPVYIKMSPGGKSAKSSSPSPPANYSAAGEEFIGVDDFNEDAHTPESKTDNSSETLKVGVPKSCGTAMTVDVRKTLVLWHNRYRSRAAKGKYMISAPHSKIQRLPPATRMPPLMYNCSLEISALNWANHVQCAIIASNKEDVGENLFEVNIAIPLKEAAENATKLWAEGISNHGISSLIRPKDDDHIGSGTQVLWAETHSVGCGAINCRNGHTMVICHYFPRGNSIGAPIYKAGKTLSECGLDVVKEVPHKNTGLCVEQTEEGDTSSSEMEHKIDEIGDLFGV